MAYDPDDSGEYQRPLKTFLDDVPVYDPELGHVPAYAALIYRGALMRREMERNDSAGAIAEEAGKGASTVQPKLAPPLVADAIDKDEAKDMTHVLEALDALETRIDLYEEKKRRLDEEAAKREIAEKMLMLAEECADVQPVRVDG